MNIGEKIKFLRNVKGLTQEDLAGKCGLSKNGLWNYENNKRQPKYETLVEIAKVLDVDLSELLERPKFTSEIFFTKISEKNIDYTRISADCKLDNCALQVALYNDPDFSSNGASYSADDYYTIGLYLGFSKEFLKKRQTIDAEIREIMTPMEYCEYMAKLDASYDLWSNNFYKDYNFLYEVNSTKTEPISEAKDNQIRMLPKNRMHSVLASNKFIQNSLLYNFVLSILVSKYYTNSIEELINKLKFDNIEQLAAFIVNDAGKYMLSAVHTSLDSLQETPEDLSFNVEALNSEIEIYSDYFSADIKTMISAENDDKSNS